MERFFGSLKHEWTHHQAFANLEEARLSVFKYIETFYNPVRLLIEEEFQRLMFDVQDV